MCVKFQIASSPKGLILIKTDSLPLIKTLLFLCTCFLLLLPMSVCSQPADTNLPQTMVLDTMLVVVPAVKISKLERLLNDHQFFNSQLAPQTYVQVLRQQPPLKNTFVYIVLGLMMLYALFFSFFRKYVTAVFRLFLNTSLNKTQITDQLRQDEFPSLLANTIFVLGMALFASQLIFSGSGRETEKIKYLIFISLLLAVIYIVKYFCLKFTGWVSSFSSQAGLYIFIVFIVNKVLGFVILPLAVMIALCGNFIKQPLLIFGIVTILALLGARFIKAFNIVRSAAKLQVFHFAIFIFAVEVLPLLLLYKAGKIYLTNLS